MAEPIRTQALPVSKARQKFGELVNQVYKRQTRIIIEKNGLPAVALVAIGDLDRWLVQERQGGPEEHNSGITERPVAADRFTVRAPTNEELVQRQALVDKILANAAQRIISPATATELIEEAREERVRDYERWTR